jgi:hypothetical protein
VTVEPLVFHSMDDVISRTEFSKESFEEASKVKNKVVSSTIIMIIALPRVYNYSPFIFDFHSLFIFKSKFNYKINRSNCSLICIW